MENSRIATEIGTKYGIISYQTIGLRNWHTITWRKNNGLYLGIYVASDSSGLIDIRIVK